jgi:SAM-dependent methyltransferase
MSLGYLECGIPISGEQWAARADAYASLISEHLSPDTVWLDAGCGLRLLEDDTDRLENWLATHCGRIVGMDVSVMSHRNIDTLVRGSIYELPFASGSFDLVTCNMVVEHLDRPAAAFAEVTRCLRPGGAFVISTPNLLNYGILSNAVASRLLPDRWRLRLVSNSDERKPDDIFRVRYKANTLRRLARLLNASGLQVHKAIPFRQHVPFFRKIERLETLLMKLTPVSALLVCAHKNPVSWE